MISNYVSSLRATQDDIFPATSGYCLMLLVDRSQRSNLIVALIGTLLLGIAVCVARILQDHGFVESCMSLTVRDTHTKVIRTVAKTVA